MVPESTKEGRGEGGEYVSSKPGERWQCTTYSTVSALFLLIKSSEAQGTYMTGPMVARSNGLVDDGAGAYEADLGLDIVIVVVFGTESRLGYRRNGSGPQLGFG